MLNLYVDNRTNCSRGRYVQSTWKITVRLPAPRQRFDGAWCSMLSHQQPMPPPGTYTVYLRESALAQELRFDPP